MPTNQTANYQLSQWKKSDRVLMEDFNADNAKIDAALKTNAAAISSEIAAREDKTTLHTILTYRAQTGGAAQTMDLSGVNWSRWRQVYLFVQLQGSGACSCGFNGMSNFFGVSLEEGDYCLIMTPMYSASLKVCGLLTGPDCRLVKCGYTYGAIQYLSLYPTSNSSITSGTLTLKGFR